MVAEIAGHLHNEASTPWEALIVSYVAISSCRFSLVDAAVVDNASGEKLPGSSESLNPARYFPTRLPLEPLLVMLCWLEGVMLGWHSHSLISSSRCCGPRSFCRTSTPGALPFPHPARTVGNSLNVVRAAGSPILAVRKVTRTIHWEVGQSSMRLTYSSGQPSAPRLPWIRKLPGTPFVREYRRPSQTGRPE
jgi:hypothetical protein